MNLLWLLALPLLGGFAAWAAGFFGGIAPRIVSLLALSAALALMPGLLHSTQAPWFDSCALPWMPGFGINLRLGMDGLAWLLVVLTLLLGIISVLVSWREIATTPGFFHANLLWSVAGAMGVFLALDMFLFFFFWELMLVPMVLIIAIWGHENARAAAIKFFLFTQGSGLLMLVAILALVFYGYRLTGRITFDYGTLLALQPTGIFGMLVMLGFFLAFIVKLAAFPFHTWLPDTHTQAPTAGSVILASILLKTGGYGLLRFAVPLFTIAAHQIAPIAMILGVISIFYGAVLAYGQTDLKRLVAYSSISHMGFVLIGIYAFNALAWQGVVVLMIAHGVSTGALFIVVGGLQQRLHTRDWRRMGGLWADAPRLSSFGAFFVLAAMGLPGLGNFIGEFLILRGSFAVAPAIAVLAAIGLIPAALYSLLAIQKAFHGVPDTARALPDFGARELGVMAVLAMGIIWIGLYPQPLLDIAAPGLAAMAGR